MVRSLESDGLSKLFPITAKIYGENEGLIGYRMVVGIEQNEQDATVTDVYFIGNGSDSGVRRRPYKVSLDKMFNLLAEAHRAGTCADLSLNNIERLDLKNPPPPPPTRWQRLAKHI